MHFNFDPDIIWCIKLCRLLGVNPIKINDKCQIALFLIWLLVIIASIIFTLVMLVSNEDMLTVKNLTNVTTNLLMLPHGLICLVTLFIHKSTINKLFYYTKEKFWMPINTKEIKQSRTLRSFLRNFFFRCVLLCIASTIMKPFLMGEGAGSYKKYKPNTFPRYFFLILEDIACTIALLSLICLDVIMLVLLMLLEVQYRMLNIKFKNLFNSQDFKRSLKECVDHQNFLNSFIDQFSKIFSAALLFCLGGIILTMCMRMYIILSNNTQINYRIEAVLHLTGGLSEILFCYSTPAQALMEQANKISESIYLSNWYQNPCKAKDVLPIMIKGLRKIEITAGGFVLIDLKMFMAALKTIISYCMFLRTVGLAKNE